MGMTIAESISILKNKGKYSLTEKENEAKGIAIETMHKYQKIQEIINNTDYIQEDVIRYKMICEVVKDGNNN